jgi:hypothetical protein
MKKFIIKSKKGFFPFKRISDNEVHLEVDDLDDIEIGDEYHTIHELYQHRMALNVALFNLIARKKNHVAVVMKSKLHYDGTMVDGGYFVVLMVHPLIGQISYHYQLKHWDKFEIPEVDRISFEYDGHSSKDVMERLLKL